MKVVAVINEQIHLDALAVARRIGPEQIPSMAGFNSVQIDDALDWATGLWDKIENALTQAGQMGMDAARPVIDAVNAQFSEVLAEAGGLAQEVRAILLERLHGYLQQMIDGALSRVQDRITVGGQTLTVHNVKIEQKLKLSSSLKMSLSELCQFVAEGEIVLSAEYAAR